METDTHNSIVATTKLEQMRLDEVTTQVLLTYISDPQFNEDLRVVAATQLKNKIKSVYGVSLLTLSQFMS